MRQLDGLRFFAVSAVMFGHWTEDIKSLKLADIYLASSGVNLFFVLSGFLITGILINNKSKQSNQFRVLKQFYVRRFLRIFPLYYLVLIIAFAINIPESRRYFYWFLTYSANYPGAFKKGALGFMAHLWSLSVEEQFYLIFPFLVLFIPNRLHAKLFKLMIVFAFISRIAFYYRFGDKSLAWWLGYMTTPSCLDCFGIGSILAYMKINHFEKLVGILKKGGLFIGALLLSCFLFILEIYYPNNFLSIVFERTFFAVFCFWLIGKASFDGFGNGFGKFIQRDSIVYIGKISYGIYVYHHFVQYFLPAEGLSLVKLLYPLITIAVAAASWHLFEYPINSLKRYFRYKRESDHALEATTVYK